MKKILLLLAIALPLAAWPVHSRIQIGPSSALAISGRVLGSDGKPMAGVAIHAVVGDHDGWLRTANDGSYEIDTIANPPQIRFEFQRPDIAKQSQTLEVKAGVAKVQHDFALK